MITEIVQPFEFPTKAYQYKITPLRECPLPGDMAEGHCPDKIVEYWKTHIATNELFDPEREWFAVVFLNTRRKIKGHQIVSSGTSDSVVVSPSNVFRLAVMAGANAIVCCHNHPSGESSPSEADIKVTKDLIAGGKLLKVEVLDHIVIGNGNKTSLREMGFFYN